MVRPIANYLSLNHKRVGDLAKESGLNYQRIRRLKYRTNEELLDSLTVREYLKLKELINIDITSLESLPQTDY